MIVKQSNSNNSSRETENIRFIERFLYYSEEKCLVEWVDGSILSSTIENTQEFIKNKNEQAIKELIAEYQIYFILIKDDIKWLLDKGYEDNGLIIEIFMKALIPIMHRSTNPSALMNIEVDQPIEIIHWKLKPLEIDGKVLFKDVKDLTFYTYEPIYFILKITNLCGKDISLFNANSSIKEGIFDWFKKLTTRDRGDLICDYELYLKKNKKKKKNVIIKKKKRKRDEGDDGEEREIIKEKKRNKVSKKNQIHSSFSGFYTIL